MQKFFLEFEEMEWNLKDKIKMKKEKFANDFLWNLFN